MTMTKRQVITLRLAQWLGLKEDSYLTAIDMHPVYKMHSGEFNPFADGFFGRAQFAECVIKADLEFGSLNRYLAKTTEPVSCPLTPDVWVAIKLEAIYYATGGQKEWKDE